MRTVRMLRGGTGVSCLLLVLVIGCAYALPLQYLPEVPGYIPVYIRHGDEPLDDVHPGFAEAFREKTSHLKNVRQFQPDHMSKESDTSSTEDDSISEKNDRSIYVVPPVKPFSVNRLYADGNDMMSERLQAKKSIEVPKNSILKTGEISEDEERELESMVAEVVREETKLNDLYDTHHSNPLYSSLGHRNINEGSVLRKLGSMQRPISKWTLDESTDESEESAKMQQKNKERGPVTYEHVPEEFSSKQQDSQEQDFAKQDDKFNDKSDESESTENRKTFDLHSRESDEVAEE